MILMKVCVLLCLVFSGPLCMSYRALADEVPAAESPSPLVLPKIKSQGTFYYPDKAKLLNAQGRFLLVFKINDHGRAVEIKMESAEGSQLLADSAVTILKSSVFERPAAPGSQQYRKSFVFELAPCGKLEHFDVPKDARTSVCASPLQQQ
jgi:Gram-negative bacterial TonB protein C-terminal